ncbi:unnamed protein product [Parnassius apollo]|uniref:(apollo) hypothetical protein n=1 Tax=Parnassius apollo TaxID=110799 RepID=A0A8S3WVN9_PARAO|nr:unnamed protein product [Parnassius apollo]
MGSPQLLEVKPYKKQAFKNPSQPQVSNTADTAERIPSPAEIELLALPPDEEDAPITVPANKGRRYLLALLHLVIAVSDCEDCDKHHLTEPPASLIEENRLRFERERDARQHELETERLKIEAQHLQLDRERVRVEEVRSRVEAEELLKITALLSLLDTRDLRPN